MNLVDHHIAADAIVVKMASQLGITVGRHGSSRPIVSSSGKIIDYCGPARAANARRSAGTFDALLGRILLCG
jgi:hypothetical protein